MRAKVKKDYWELLPFMFPKFKWMVGNPITSFDNGKYLIISESDLIYKDRDYKSFLILTDSDCLLKFEDNRSIIEFIDKYIVKIKNKKFFEELDSEDFIMRIKWLLLLREEVEIVNQDSFNMFKFFTNLFKDSNLLFKMYFQENVSHEIIISSMITMMAKAKDWDRLKKISPSYRNALRANSVHLDKFKLFLERYFQTNRTETDFLVLIYNLSVKK